MLDFLKLQTYDLTLVDYFNNSELLSWLSDTDKISHSDNEVITTKKVKLYKGIFFCFYSNRLDILIKPHYYFNDNLHNANDFDINDCNKIIRGFKNDFKVDLTRFKVVNIEFGLNVISPIDIKELIMYIAYHDKNEFRTDSNLPYSKKSYSTNKSGIANGYKVIKAYAKGIQFPQYCNQNTFRFEVKSKEYKYCRDQLSINNANDLLNTGVYFKMIEVLIKEFNEVLILDCITNFEGLKPKELKKVNEYNNPFVWYKFSNQNRNSFSKNKTNYYRLIDKVENNLKNQLQKIILDKLQTLKKGAISTPKENIKKGAISTIYKGGICNLNTNNNDEVKNNVCKITGLDISMQKESGLLSHTGLKHYYENDKKIFEQIKQLYLSKQWQKSDFQKQIKEIAHNIRNTISNQKIKQERLYQPKQLNILNTLGI
jgi:hypothetical protein